MTETMETQQIVMGSKELAQIIKGKRTKRQRPASPLALGMSSSSNPSTGEISERERIRSSSNNNTTSPSSSVEFAESTVEEEDMANCLILLAQGNQTRKLLSEPAAIATTTTGKVPGVYVYQCKTCNRCFPSFQALGGHRASHKKPKPASNEKKKVLFGTAMEEQEDQFHDMNTTLSLQISSRGLCSDIKTSKIHECSTCGAEFSSGQALGGHMRRHRAFASTSTTPSTATTTVSLGSSSPDESQESKKPRNSLQLDLNLPAPEDDLRESKFGFASKEQVLVFAASPLIDCHY